MKILFALPDRIKQHLVDNLASDHHQVVAEAKVDIKAKSKYV